MKACNELYVVGGGDHSLVVEKARLKANGQTQDDLDQGVTAGIESFFAGNRAEYLFFPPLSYEKPKKKPPEHPRHGYPQSFGGQDPAGRARPQRTPPWQGHPP